MSALNDIATPELAALARDGDRDAFAELLTRHYPALLGSCRQMVGDVELAKDAAQEASVRALLGIGSLRHESRFGSWLIGIGLNVCRGWIARTQHSRAQPLTDSAALHTDATGDTTFEAAVADELARRVRAAIADLPVGQRDAVVRFYLLGLTQAEIAADLNTGPGAVKTRLSKARHTLRRSLNDTYQEHIDMPTHSTESPDSDPNEMVPVRVAGLRRTAPNQDGLRSHIVFLQSDAGQQLPIWIGPAEATALALILEKVETPRPGVYQFAASLLTGAGGRVSEVRVTELTANTFFAQVILDNATVIDARPSDAITLAVLNGVPITVRQAVFAAGEQNRATRSGLIEAAESATEDEQTIAVEAIERYKASIIALDKD